MLARKIHSKASPKLSIVPEETAPHSRVEFLRKVSLFNDIEANPVAMEQLALAMEEKNYEPKSSIIREGETGSEMFFLIQGEANVFKTTAEGELYKVAILRGEQHAFFGEGGLLDSDARSATINAETDCRCLVLKKTAFEKFGSSHPDWALPVLLRIARAVMGRLKKTNNDLMLLYHALVAEIRGH